MIHTRELTRRFRTKGGDVEAVRGIDLDVEPGEIVAFLGPNGAGKSTTLRMLTTLLPPTSGTAEVAGLDVVRDPVGVRGRIGYIGQGHGTSEEFRVREELVTQGRYQGLRRAEARRRADDLLDRLSLGAMADRGVGTLSGGQRRRLDIALGLIHQPRLIFLDEPSTGLDPQTRASLWEHITGLRESFDTTVFLTTHYLEEADNAAERVIVIDHGRIIADGTPDQLKAKVSGDLVRVALGTEAEAASAAEIAGRLPTAHEVTVTDTAVSLRVARGHEALAELVNGMLGRELRPLDVRVVRPTLDDVYLTLTGRSMREDRPDA